MLYWYKDTLYQEQYFGENWNNQKAEFRDAVFGSLIYYILLVNITYLFNGEYVKWKSWINPGQAFTNDHDGYHHMKVCVFHNNIKNKSLLKIIW